MARTKSIVLDSSVLFQLGNADWDFLKDLTRAGHIQVWDSVVGLIELIRHIHQPDCGLRDKTGWVANRCCRLEEIAPKHMLPHPGLVVQRALQEWLKWNRSETEVIRETNRYLALRKLLAEKRKLADDPEIVEHLLGPTEDISKAFQDSLDSLRAEMHADYVDKVRTKIGEKPGRFRNILTSHIQKQADWQSSMFVRLMEHHNVRDKVKAAVALEWRKIPFLQRLLSIYNLQIGRFVDTDRPATVEDFIDFEWAAYISSSRIDLFLTNNERDFQQALLNAPEISRKVRTWTEFRSDASSR